VTLKGNAGEVKDERTNTYWRSTLCGSPHSFIVKGKIDKLDFINIKNLCASKDISKNVK